VQTEHRTADQLRPTAKLAHRQLTALIFNLTQNGLELKCVCDILLL